MENNSNKQTVSIIIPVLNEEKYISVCIDSLLNQTYPIDKMEIIVIDGCSTDNTVKLCESFMSRANIRVLSNPQKKTTYALNQGIKESTGRYIIRIDAHANYAKDYVEKCVSYLQTMDIENVGGIAITKGKGKMGSAIACMLSSKFGVGGSGFRTDAVSGYVDTVPFGAFRKELFDKIGYFNHNLPRSEDNDINARIRSTGGKVWLANDIHFTYYCRDTLSGILKMALQNGNALFRTLAENPRAMSIRHFIPFGFFISIVLLPIGMLFTPIAGVLLGAELLAYGLLDIYFSFKGENRKYTKILLWLYPLFHITYGLGSFLGLIAVKLY